MFPRSSHQESRGCHFVPSLEKLISQWQLLGSSTVKLLLLWEGLLSLDKYVISQSSLSKE